MPETPPVFLPYQKQLMQSVYDNPVTVVEKSRRTGYSWAMGGIASLIASAERSAGGQDVLYLGYNLEMAREFIDYVADFAKQILKVAANIQDTVFEDDTRPEKSIKAFRIEFASGFKVLALPSVPRSLRGMQGLVVIDEAAFHDDLPEVMKAAFALLIWGGKVVIISTHDGAENPFNTLCEDIKKGNLPYKLLHCSFDEAVRDGLFKRICFTKGEEWTAEKEIAWVDGIRAFYGDSAAEELDCVPSRGSGGYFSRIIIENCQDKTANVLRYTQPADFVLDERRSEKTSDWLAENLRPVIDSLPTNKRTVLGQDFGRDGDLSVIWVLQEDNPTLWKTAFVLELRSIPFDVQQQILFAVMDSLPLFHHAKFDARGNGQSHAEAALQRYGSARVECVMASPKWYGEWFPKYKRAYEDRTIAVPVSEDIIADHRLVVLNKGVPSMSDKRVKGSDGKYRHGDSAVAGVLAWAAARTEGEPPAGASLNKPERSFKRVWI